MLLFRRYLSSIREKGEVYFALVIAYQKLGNTDEARAAFTRALELNPDRSQFQEVLENLH